jgi:hypothetical protein
MSDTDNNYIGILLEEIRDQNKAVLEAVGDMQQNVAKIPHIEKTVERLEDSMEIVRAAVTDMSNEQKGHERRLTQLEAT